LFESIHDESEEEDEEDDDDDDDDNEHGSGAYACRLIFDALDFGRNFLRCLLF
jgi:hypothetical protein